MKPAFSYYGGKQRMVPKIIPLLPKHTVYVEPFAGGAAVFFAKPWPDVSNRDHYGEVLNDMDGRITNFYRVCQDPVKRDELLERLSFTPYSREEYRRATKDEHETDVDQAWAWFVDISMSFSNKSGRGWGTAVYGRNHPATWQRNIERLLPACERLAGVYIENDDALSVIERWDSPQTLFYCDPPYPGAVQGYKHKYNHEEFGKLVETLDACTGSFLLSAYEIGLCPDHWERFEFSATASSSGRGQVGAGRDKSRAATQEEMGDRSRKEVVWRMDRSANARPEIRSLFDSGAHDCFGGSLGGTLFDSGAHDDFECKMLPMVLGREVSE